MVVPSTSPTPTPTPLIESFEKREPVYSSIEANEPILEVLAGSAADALKERATAGNGFDSLLCATLKALKGENPDTFTGLLNACTSLIDSSPQKRTETLKERNVIDNKENLAGNQLDQPGLNVDDVAEKRSDERLDSLRQHTV